MGLSDAATPPTIGLWLRLGGCPSLAAGRPGRASQVPDGSVGACCLQTPRRVPPGRMVGAAGPVLASPSLGGWPLSSWR